MIMVTFTTSFPCLLVIKCQYLSVYNCSSKHLHVVAFIPNVRDTSNRYWRIHLGEYDSKALTTFVPDKRIMICISAQYPVLIKKILKERTCLLHLCLYVGYMFTSALKITLPVEWQNKQNCVFFIRAIMYYRLKVNSTDN